MNLVDVWISTSQLPGAGANWEAFYLFKAHFLGGYWYLALGETFLGKD